MAKKNEKNRITGLDIGTSKIIALIGEIGADGTIEVVGIGRHPSRGLKRGVVVDIERITLLDVINSEPDWQIKLLDINPAIKVRFMKEEKNDEITKIYISVPMI